MNRSALLDEAGSNPALQRLYLGIAENLTRLFGRTLDLMESLALLHVLTTWRVTFPDGSAVNDPASVESIVGIGAAAAIASALHGVNERDCSWFRREYLFLSPSREFDNALHLVLAALRASPGVAVDPL